MSNTEPSTICSKCWSHNSFDPAFAILTYRGPWLKHHSMLCDSRKLYLLHNDPSSHCACDLTVDMSIQGTDQRTPTYCGLTHDYSELENMNEFQDWENFIVKKVKSNPDIDPTLDFLWLAALFVGSLPRIQFKLKSTPLQLCIAMLFKIELASNYSDWLKAREMVLEQWKLAEIQLPNDLAAIARRNLMEYLCGRALSRVNQLETFQDIPVHVKHIKDPLLKQTLGGSWCTLGYIALDSMNSLKCLNLGDSAWVDVTGSTFNNWASIHRDVTDGTFNNSYYYYKNTGFSMSEDLHSLIYYSLKLSGSAIRSVLAHIDLCDMNSRYKFSENYYHCQAEAYEPISQPREIMSRLNKYYGSCTQNQLTSYDVYCYCLNRSKHSNSSNNFSINPNFKSLAAALHDCLGLKNSEQYLSKLVIEIGTALNYHIQLKKASQDKDHTRITKLSLEFRKLRMTQWSMELNNRLPIGSNLIIVYHISSWFMNTMLNVDKGYAKLAESQYQFST